MAITHTLSADVATPRPAADPTSATDAACHTLQHALKRVEGAFDFAFGARSALAFESRHALEISYGARRGLAARSLGLGLVALIAAGVLSIVLLFSRQPGIQNLLSVADFFHVALLAHVDPSVLVWILAMTGAAHG